MFKALISRAGLAALILAVGQSCTTQNNNNRFVRGFYAEYSGSLSDKSRFTGIIIFDRRNDRNRTCAKNTNGFSCSSTFRGQNARDNAEIPFQCDGGITGKAVAEEYRRYSFGRIASRAWVTLSSGQVGAVEIGEPKAWSGEDLCTKL